MNYITTVRFIILLCLSFTSVIVWAQSLNSSKNYLSTKKTFQKNPDVFKSNDHLKKHIFNGTGPIKTKQNNNKQYKAVCFTQSVYRQIDGNCNNINGNDLWGSTNIQLNRFIPAVYNANNDLVGANRAHPRMISNIIFKTDEDLPSDRLSSFVFTWGQFIDHDITLVHTDSLEANISPLPNDIIISPIPFNRSEALPGTGENGIAREQINAITAWIDASNVYGSDIETAHQLRTFKDGKLKTAKANNGEDILPIINNQYLAGDERALEQPGLTSLHVLFVREHNRICDALLACGMTNDESIYQRARKKVGALLQSITYNEFLPALGIQLPQYNGYNNTVKPDILNVFAAAAYRIGHTMVTDELVLYNDEGQLIETMSLAEAFFDPTIAEERGIETILNGLAKQFQQKIDVKVVESLRSFLFGAPPNAGFDLVALNIQRGRDHGLDDYNAYRTAFGLPPAFNFSDITSDADLQRKLQLMYNYNINDIDVWVGLLAEDHLPNASVGQTLHAILSKQFTALRDGDFYYYQNDPKLSKEEKQQINNTQLADIIKRNTNIKNIKQHVFYGPCYADNITYDCEQDIYCHCANTEICNQGVCEPIVESETCICSINVQLNNPGTCAVVIHSIQSGAKKYITTIEPKSTFTLNTNKGEVLKAQNANNLQDLQYYFITHCDVQIVNISLKECIDAGNYCLENSVEENEINTVYQVNVFNQITANHAVLPDARVDYRAGKKIILKPGFKATRGSYFNARIDNLCSNYRQDEGEINTSEEALQTLQIELYPNPANELVYINYQLAQASNINISMHNAMGEELYRIAKKSQNTGKHKMSFNIQSLPAGIYYLKIGTQNYMETERLIVHH